MTISILNWSEHYQPARSSRLKDPKWLPIPVAHDVRFLALNGTENGCAAVAVMLSLLRLAACGNPKGSLIHGDRELSIDDLSKLSGIPTYIIDQSLPLLQSEGLIEYTKSGQGRPSRAQNLGSDVHQSRGDKSRGEETRPVGSPAQPGHFDIEPTDPVHSRLPGSKDPEPQPPLPLDAPDSVSIKPVSWADTQSVSPEQQVYNLHPRKYRKRESLNHIGTAIKLKGLEYIMARTRAYAKAVSAWPEAEKKWIKSSVYWYRDEMYDAEPGTWLCKDNASSPADAWEEKHSRSTKDLEQVFKDLYSKGGGNVEHEG